MAAPAPAPAPAASHSVDLSDVSDLTIISLWKRIYSFLPELLRTSSVFTMGAEKAIVNGMLVCKAFKEELASLVKHMRISRYGSSGSPQQQLKHLADTFTNLHSLDITIEYDDHTPSLDFSKVCFPNLRSLSLYCAPIRSMEFTQQNTPKLEMLTLNNCQSVRAIKLDLPELESVDVEFLEVQDARGFGRSLSSCPKLKRFTSYKLWGLGGVKHNLNLPECDELSLHRSDDLDALDICAPQLHSLELRACYSLEWVRILPDPEGTTPTPLRVNLINANIDRVSKQHLKTHLRLKAPGGKYITKESQDEFASMFDEGGGMSGSEEDEDSDDDDDGEGPMFGMEGFLQMMQMMGQEANMDPQIAAMIMQEGPFGMFAHDEADTDDEDEYETDSEGGAVDHNDPDHDGNPDHDPDHQGADGPGFPGGMAGMPAGLSAMLAMAMMNGMPVSMAMDGVHMMAAGYGDDSGSMDDDDELEEGTEDGDDDDDVAENKAGGGPSCVIEEVE